MRNGHLGHAMMLGHRQTKILPVPTRIVPLGRAGRFHQQPAQQRVALLADVPQAALVGAGLLDRNQPQIAAHLLAPREPFPVPDGQHISQRNHRTHARMGHQKARLRVLFCGLVHRFVQRLDPPVHLLQQGNQILAPLHVPPRQRQSLDLVAAHRAPYPLAQQAFVLGHRIQLVLEPGTHPHHAATVHQ